jgi:hypothetical protein
MQLAAALHGAAAEAFMRSRFTHLTPVQRSAGMFMGTALLFLGSTLPATADPITISFTTFITYSSGPAELAIGVPVNVGDAFQGTITVEASRVGGCANCSTVYGPPYGMFVDAGSGLLLNRMTVASWSGLDGIGETFQFSSDSLSLDPLTLPTLRDYGRITGGLVFTDPDGVPPVPNGFPPDFALLKEFPIRAFDLVATVDTERDPEDASPKDFRFGGVLTAVEWAAAPSPVPEPGTLGLVVVIGGGALALSRACHTRRRRRDAPARR